MKMVKVTSDVVTTPVMQNKQKRIICEDIKSPPTPHRIELRSESIEDKCENVKTNFAKNFQPVPKSRRKLTDNVISNHLEKKTGDLTNHKLTEYFPVRRSVRKTQKTVLEEKQRSLEIAVRNEIEDGLEIKIFEEKGRGVVATKDFRKGEFVVEYSGDLIDIVEAKLREERYAQDNNTGCYMYYFKHNNQQYCIDATPETGRLGRLVNHSRNGNLITRTITVDKKPRLILLAKDDIRKGEEVLYDYGDRSKESLLHHPWLAY